MQLTPVITVHMTAALGALVTGPVALWARRGAQQRPKLHRAFGYAWVTLMIVTAVSALFIRDFRLPNLAGYTPIHLLVPFSLTSLFGSFWFLARGNIAAHRKIMQQLYIGACVVAGAFTLLPGRYLGELVWVRWLGLLPAHEHPAASDPSMLQRILTSTPGWVWALLAGLLVLGLSQVRSRRASLVRVSITPLAMIGLSVSGTVSAFAASPLLVAVLAVWAVVAATVFAVVAPGQSGASYDAASRSFAVPGSWTPLVLILAVFLTKYAAGVALAMQPQLAGDAVFSLTVAALYGLFSGLFAGRAARLWRLVLWPRQLSAVPV